MRESFLYKGISVNKEILELDITIWKLWGNNEARKGSIMAATTISWQMTGIFLALAFLADSKCV